MCDFHYSYIKAKYGCGAELLLTNTGSLVNEIETKYLLEVFYEDKNLFDFSDYPENSQFYDQVNNKNNW